MGAIPQFTQNGRISSVLVTAANTDSSGVGTIGSTNFLVLLADATNGTLVEFVRFIPVATVAGTPTSPTVGRIFASSVTSGATTSANTFLLAEVVLAAQSADNTATAVNQIDIPLNFRLPAGWTLLATNHAAPASNTNWRATAVGGDY